MGEIIAIACGAMGLGLVVMGAVLRNGRKSGQRVRPDVR